MTAITMARFVIQGSALTAGARDKTSDGDWKGAVALLRESLVGMSYEQAISIIEGRNKLIGEGDTVNMVPEDAAVTEQVQERYRADLAYDQYVRDGNTLYQPYRVIDNLGPADANLVMAYPEFQESQTGAFTRYPQWMADAETVHAKACYPAVLPAKTLELRAMHYADNPKSDKAFVQLTSARRKVVVLYRQVAEGITPFWREKDNRCFTIAYLAARSYLPVEGFAERYGYLHPDEVKREPVNPVPPPEDPEVTRKRLERLAAEDAAATLREARKLVDASEIRAKVTAFADADTEYGWLEYRWKDPANGTYLTLRAPRRALHCYALARTAASNQMPEYTAFSPDSFKTGSDCQYHTDVWLGCGFALDDNTYQSDSREYRALLDLMFEVQRSLLNFEVQVLARGPERYGKVVFADSQNIDENCVLVVPHAGVEFELQAMAAGAVICEAGGRLAHLVTVCREQSKAIMRMDGACTKLRPGQLVTVHPDIGRISIYSGMPAVF